VGLLAPLAAALDRLAIEVGEVRLSALGAVQGLALLIALLWIARLASSLIEGRLRRSTAFSPAMQVLAVKMVRVGLIAVAVVVALTAVGVDLTAFAVFSGALGVGLGFGLQKVVSNLISGFILLMDRSIKPGDVIETEGTYGAITRLHARYVSIVTRDNTEYLIPNEDLITNRVINWSYSSDLIRLRVPIGISYDSDVRLAMALCIEAAESVERVVSQPKPRCMMSGFGDSSVDLDLRFWIRDPANGTKNVASDVLLGVWDRFHENGIQIPFPQRDLHLKTADTPMPVRVARADEGAGEG
jgi:small-conductance mechanosensitive channel